MCPVLQRYFAAQQFWPVDLSRKQQISSVLSYILIQVNHLYCKPELLLISKHNVILHDSSQFAVQWRIWLQASVTLASVVQYKPSTALVEKNARLRVSRGFSWVYSAALDCGSDSPVSDELSTCNITYVREMQVIIIAIMYAKENRIRHRTTHLL